MTKATGRPTGRPKGSLNKVTAEIRSIAQEHGPAVIAELARLALNSASDAARVAALKELLDRGYGKSAQPLTGEGGEGPITVVAKIQRDAAVRAALRADT